MKPVVLIERYPYQYYQANDVFKTLGLDIYIHCVSHIGGTDSCTDLAEKFSKYD